MIANREERSDEAIQGGGSKVGRSISARLDGFASLAMTARLVQLDRNPR